MKQKVIEIEISSIIVFLTMTVMFILIVITQFNLNKIKEKIGMLENTTNSQIMLLHNQIYNLRTENEEAINELSTRLKNVESSLYVNIELLSSKINSLSTELENISKQISRLSHRVLTYPAFEDVKRFLEKDNTDKQEYREETFICTDFANMFIENFRNEGFYSCLTYLYFGEGAHAIVSIYTTDLGKIYVEPQDDKIIFDLKPGDNYCEKVGWDCNLIIKRIIDCFDYGR